MSAFDRLTPFIQEFIFDHRWNELRDVQAQAIDAVLDTDGHVLITSGTASGKTEAAFFPILTALTEAPSASFGVMYIGPLKALINDQFERISDLIRQAELPICAWHGDRSAAEKNQAVREPRGILQITPESLEALLMKRAGDARRMFSDLRFVVIDELHAFMGTDRGLQLQCQLARLERLVGHGVRRVGLSATIQNPEAAGQWLAAGSELGTAIVNSATGGRQLNLSLRHDAFPLTEAGEAAAERRAARMDYLYREVSRQKCLVFTNSRMEAESVAMALGELAEQRGEANIYRVHHGSISANLREETESALRSDDKPAVVVATKTLELGIDLGGLDKVVQLGAPGSCSGFVQRLGRAGRRGTPAVMRFLTTHEPDPARPFETLPWALLQNIAVIQLYLEERWVEHFESKRCPYSLLFHQTLSHLMGGESTGRELARAVLTLPPFRAVDPMDYRTLLDHMLASDMIEKTESGTLIPGLKGERLAGGYQFYSVFAERDGWRVLHQLRLLGEIDEAPEPGQNILLAGRAWRVDEIDLERRCVHVYPSAGSAKRQWSGGGAGMDDHVVSRMRRLLRADEDFPYLLSGARQALNEARKTARACRLDGVYTPVDEERFLLHPWLGSRKLATLDFLLTGPLKERLGMRSLRSAGPLGFTVAAGLEPDRWLRALLRELSALREEDVIGYAPGDPQDRYDAYVPPCLRQKAYVYDRMDIPGVKRWGEALTERMRKRDGQ